jgi:hypothetical protein
MRGLTWLCVSIVAAMAVPCLVEATLTTEHFNYGDAPCPLWNQNGGENWGGPWAGYDNLSPQYSPTAGLLYTGGCYSNSDDFCGHESNDPTQGGTVQYSQWGSPRPLPGELDGTVWVSVLARLGTNDSYRGFFLGNDQLTFWFGLNSQRNVYVTFSGFETAVGIEEYSYTATHLVLAKLEFNYDEQENDRVSVWVNPENTCEGEEALGAADAFVDGYDVAVGWATLMLDLGNGSNVDAIRLSHGSSACLNEVLYYPTGWCPVEDRSWTGIKALYR